MIEEALRRYRLKYHVVGGLSFYDRAEIKDLIGYLKVAINPDDSISMLRIVNTPPRGIGNTTVEKIEQLALESNLSFWGALQIASGAQGLAPRALGALADFARLIIDMRALSGGQAPVIDLLKWIIDRTRFTAALQTAGDPEAAGRLENIQELLNAAADSSERAEELSDFLDHAALVSDADDLDERAQISLLTLHTAKGLEFSLVFLAGLEEGLFPHSRTLNDTPALEEERRLCYVGMTRAEDRLILTRARFRRRYGSEMPDETEPLALPARSAGRVDQRLESGEAPARAVPRGHVPGTARAIRRQHPPVFLGARSVDSRRAATARISGVRAAPGTGSAERRAGIQSGRTREASEIRHRDAIASRR